MTEHEAMVAALADDPASGPLLMFLGKTRRDLEALSEDELRELMEPAAQFQKQAALLEQRAAAILLQYMRLKKQPCLIDQRDQRAQRLRDLEAEYTDLVRRLREEFFIDHSDVTNRGRLNVGKTT